MKPKSIAIVGAAETTRLGVIPDMSQIQLHADAALNAIADLGKEVVHRGRIGFSVLRPYREPDRVAHLFTQPAALLPRQDN